MVGLCALLSSLSRTRPFFSPLSLHSSLVCLSSRPAIISGGLSLSREAPGKLRWCLVDGATPSQHTNRHLTNAEVSCVLFSVEHFPWGNSRRNLKFLLILPFVRLVGCLHGRTPLQRKSIAVI